MWKTWIGALMAGVNVYAKHVNNAASKRANPGLSPRTCLPAGPRWERARWGSVGAPAPPDRCRWRTGRVAIRSVGEGEGRAARSGCQRGRSGRLARTLRALSQAGVGARRCGTGREALGGLPPAALGVPCERAGSRPRRQDAAQPDLSGTRPLPALPAPPVSVPRSFPERRHRTPGRRLRHPGAWPVARDGALEPARATGG